MPEVIKFLFFFFVSNMKVAVLVLNYFCYFFVIFFSIFVNNIFLFDIKHVLCLFFMRLSTLSFYLL